jgi:hypothetical protein
MPSSGYQIPYAYSSDRLWDMNFGDAVYYLAAHRGLPFQITARACVTLMNGTPVLDSRYEALRHHFMTGWKEARQAGWLKEVTPDYQKAEKPNTGTLRLSYRGSNRYYLFNLPALVDKSPWLIRKPTGYVANGWINALGSVYSKRLLNFLLRQSHLESWPPLSTTGKTLREFAAAAPSVVHPSRVQAAWQQLIEYELILLQGQYWQVNWPGFERLAPGQTALSYPGEPVFEADWLTAQVIDISCAQLSRKVQDRGHWSPLLFWRIFSDLVGATLAQRQLALVQAEALPAMATGYRLPSAWTCLWQKIQEYKHQ